MAAFGASCLLLSLALVEALPHVERSRPQPMPEPGTLDWAPCELDFPADIQEQITVPYDCATLEVPLDYTDPNSERTIELQLVKINATVEPFQGSIIFNPGGPGASGVQEVVTKGPLYRDVLGGQFNVIGFDTRGTGKTIPFVCDLTNMTAGSDTLSRRDNFTTLPNLGTWDLLVNKGWDDFGMFAESCYQSQQEYGRFLSTSFVARDMLRIVDALNEDGLLRFWGRSYSTVLGQTFAAMFPDRVGRMLLDSIVLGSDYHNGKWITATRDTERALHNFLTECVNAGPEVCPIANYSGPDTTPQNLKDAIVEVFEELEADPIILPDSYPVQPWWRPGGMPLFHELKYFLLVFFYYPSQFPITAEIIGSILARDFSMFGSDGAQAFEAPESWNEGTHNFYGIGCSDGSYRASSVEDMYSMYQAQIAQGPFAEAFSSRVWVCAQWKFDAAERYEGDFMNITTNFPILFANTMNDPITSLSAAYEATVGFKGSRFLVSEGHGHGVMNHPSECMVNAIGEYFANGTLPEVGKKCKPDQTAYEVALEMAGATIQERSLDNQKSDVMMKAYELARRNHEDHMTQFGRFRGRS